MKTITAIVFKSFRVSTIAVLMLALLVSVGYTGQGKIEFRPLTSAVTEQPAPTANALQPGPPSADQAGGKMAPAKTRRSFPAIFNASPATYKSGNDGSRFNALPLYDCDWLVAVQLSTRSGRLPHSTAMISSLLGRQFTLVGAKPSGTM